MGTSGKDPVEDALRLLSSCPDHAFGRLTLGGTVDAISLEIKNPNASYWEG